MRGKKAAAGTKKPLPLAGRDSSRRIGAKCAHPGCSAFALPLSDPPSCPAHLADFRRWVEAVENEPDKIMQALATQAYVIHHEEIDPISSKFYRIAGGTPPPGVKDYIGTPG